MTNPLSDAAGRALPPESSALGDFERAEVPNLSAQIMVDLADRSNPIVVLRLVNAGISVDFRIEAAKAGAFGAQVGQGMIVAAQQALAAAGPKLVTPPAAGGLLIPGNGAMPPMPGRGV